MKIVQSLALLATSFAVGCGGVASKDQAETVPVAGTVVYEGQPVADAVVTFHGGPRQAVGRTDERGRFVLRTYEAGDGATVGSHVVTVTKYAGGSADSGDEPVSMEAAMNQPTSPGPPENVLPQKYADPAAGTLVLEVTADGENDFEVELSD